MTRVRLGSVLGNTEEVVQQCRVPRHTWFKADLEVMCCGVSVHQPSDVLPGGGGAERGLEPGVLRVCARLLLVPVHGDLGPGAGLEVPAPRRHHLIGTRRVSPGFIVASTSSLQLFIKTVKQNGVGEYQIMKQFQLQQMARLKLYHFNPSSTKISPVSILSTV